MFGFIKKQSKMSPEKNWQNIMTNFFNLSKIDLTNTQEKEYWLTYGLGYLSEYLKVNKAKDKHVPEIEQQLLLAFGDYSQEEARELRRRIDRSTTSYSPLYQELIFRGIEVFHACEENQEHVLAIKKEEISELLTTNLNDKD